MAESAVEKKARLAAEKEAANNQNTQLEKSSELPPFMKEKVDEDTGEVKVVPEFKYMEGLPREYKADAKEGNFFIQSKNVGQTLTFQPIAWRFFADDLFGLGLRNWAEVFFIDEKDVVSAILFHGFSAEALAELAQPLYYDDQSLADVIITASWQHLKNEKAVGKPTYCIAEFKYDEGETERTKYLKEYAKTQKFYRRATLKETAEFTASQNYYNPYDPENQVHYID